MNTYYIKIPISGFRIYQVFAENEKMAIKNIKGDHPEDIEHSDWSIDENFDDPQLVVE